MNTIIIQHDHSMRSSYLEETGWHDNTPPLPILRHTFCHTKPLEQGLGVGHRFASKLLEGSGNYRGRNQRRMFQQVGFEIRRTRPIHLITPHRPTISQKKSSKRWQLLKKSCRDWVRWAKWSRRKPTRIQTKRSAGRDTRMLPPPRAHRLKASSSPAGSRFAVFLCSIYGHNSNKIISEKGGQKNGDLEICNKNGINAKKWFLFDLFIYRLSFEFDHISGAMHCIPGRWLKKGGKKSRFGGIKSEVNGNCFEI